MIFQESKTKTSIYKIAIQKKLSKAFVKYQKEQQWVATFLGDKFDKRMIKQAGVVEGFTFHDLRHTHATLLLQKGVNIKVISERLGHSKIQLTLDGI